MKLNGIHTSLTESKIPILISDQIILRPFQLSDAKEVQRQAGNPKVAAMTATIPHPYLDGLAEEWIAKHQEWFEKGVAVSWAIELKTKSKLIGCISLAINKIHNRAELGYWVGEEFWNNGYCSEAAITVVKFAFDSIGLNKITSRHMAENQSSGKVMQKAGLEKEGFLKEDFFRNNRFVDMVVYGLTRSNRF